MISGPPAFAPNWFCVKAGALFGCLLRISLALLNGSFAFRTRFRRYSYASPCKPLLPDFVLRLMTPPENLPQSDPRLLVWTLNSWIESWVGITTGRLM